MNLSTVTSKLFACLVKCMSLENTVLTRVLGDHLQLLDEKMSKIVYPRISRPMKKFPGFKS